MKLSTLKLRIRAVPQNDDCGCGYFALSAVFKFYGLNPRELSLRPLLGTDHALPFGFPGRDLIEQSISMLGEGSGTWPQDIFAVLFRHGFQTRIAPSNYKAFRRSLRLHLLHGHPAVALVDRMAHWVVISGIGPDGVWITDSCADENDRHTYFMEDEDYESRRVAEIFVSRRKNAEVRGMTNADYAREYWRGTQFVAPFLGRAAVAGLRYLLRR